MFNVLNRNSLYWKTHGRRPEKIGAKLNFIVKETQEYGAKRIIRQIGNGANVKCILRKYGCSPAEDIIKLPNIFSEIPLPRLVRATGTYSENQQG